MAPKKPWYEPPKNKPMKFRFTTAVGLCLLSLLLSTAVHAQLRLPKLISDGMVLQRDAPLKVWGWAGTGEKITVRLKNKTYKTTTGADGKWQVTLPATPAGGPFTMEIAGKSRLTVKDILIGDVWFCSGQSNMVHQMNIHDVRYAKEIAEANDPQIRQFWVPTMTSLQGPQSDVPNGQWKAAVGEDIRPFSAVAYFFAKKLYAKYKVPIGIINASVGGTPIEAWTSEEGLTDFSALKATIEKNKDTTYINSADASTNRHCQPACPARRSGDGGGQKVVRGFVHSQRLASDQCAGVLGRSRCERAKRRGVVPERNRPARFHDG